MLRIHFPRWPARFLAGGVVAGSSLTVVVQTLDKVGPVWMGPAAALPFFLAALTGVAKTTTP